MKTWADCIVSLLDLVGIKKLVAEGGPKGSRAMLDFHRLLQVETSDGLRHHQHVYVWNDSALLLALIDNRHIHFEPIMKEVDDLKKQIDIRWPCYAISVKGKTFPTPSAKNIDGKFIFLRASSYAFANCFTIEKELGGKYRKPWYVDIRIAKHIRTSNRSNMRRMIKLMPYSRPRYIYMYDTYLWEGPSQDAKITTSNTEA
jgi:hypothetical protein